MCNCKRNLQVVVVINTEQNRYALLFSTDIDLEPLKLYRYYKGRFQIEFVFRDAKQFTGLNDCQARSKAKLDFSFQCEFERGECGQAGSSSATRRDG